MKFGTDIDAPLRIKCYGVFFVYFFGLYGFIDRTANIRQQTDDGEHIKHSYFF